MASSSCSLLHRYFISLRCVEQFVTARAHIFILCVLQIPSGCRWCFLRSWRSLVQLPICGCVSDEVWVSLRFRRDLSVRAVCGQVVKRVISVLYNYRNGQTVHTNTDLNGIFTATRRCQVYHSALLTLTLWEQLMSALWTVCVCARACVCEVEQTVYVLFNRTSSMLMNVQPGDRCVKLCRMFLSCRTLFHTCTGMTWSRYIIDTRGEIYENKIWICMLNTSFSFLSFVSVCLIRTSVLLRSSWTASDKKGNPFSEGGFPSESNWSQLDLRLKPEEWKAWLSLTMTGVGP